MRTSRLIVAVVAVAATTIAVPSAATAADGGAATWRVTVTNLTPAGSQPLSPPLFVVHDRGVHVWQVGQIASHGVAAIAEDADNSVLESALPQLPGVRAVFTGAGGPIPPGASATYEVTAHRGARVSIVTMLVNTNDAFTGFDGLRLSGRHTVIDTMAYDAGSEANNELAAFIPGPCCNNPFARSPEGELIRPHAGITGVGDLDPAVYDWPGAAARFTFERIG